VNKLLTYAIMLELLTVAYLQIVIMLIQFKKVISVKCQQCETGSGKYHSPIGMNYTKKYGCLLTFLLHSK
jgi:hypothetical protein